MKNWTKKTLELVLAKAKISIPWSEISKLSHDEFNELGDWAYYQAADTPDFIRNRPVPKIVRALRENVKR